MSSIVYWIWTGTGWAEKDYAVYSMMEDAPMVSLRWVLHSGSCDACFFKRLSSGFQKLRIWEIQDLIKWRSTTYLCKGSERRTGIGWDCVRIRNLLEKLWEQKILLLSGFWMSKGDLVLRVHGECRSERIEKSGKEKDFTRRGDLGLF